MGVNFTALAILALLSCSKDKTQGTEQVEVVTCSEKNAEACRKGFGESKEIINTPKSKITETKEEQDPLTSSATPTVSNDSVNEEIQDKFLNCEEVILTEDYFKINPCEDKTFVPTFTMPMHDVYFYFDIVDSVGQFYNTSQNIAKEDFQVTLSVTQDIFTEPRQYAVKFEIEVYKKEHTEEFLNFLTLEIKNLFLSQHKVSIILKHY